MALGVPLQHCRKSILRVGDFSVALVLQHGTAEGTATILVEHYILKWGVPATLLSENGEQFTANRECQAHDDCNTVTHTETVAAIGHAPTLDEGEAVRAIDGFLADIAAQPAAL